MLSKDNVSGVTEDVVLLRCADLRIFLFAAWTIFATNRDEDSLCDSLLNAGIIKSSNFIKRINHELIKLIKSESLICSEIKTHVQFWRHFPKENQPMAVPGWFL